jgi:streptogramin lyase
MDVVLMDGETGVIESTTPVGVASDNYGIYGGAVDADGNFWGSMLSGQTLFRVNISDLSVSTWPAPSGYGMTVDPQGRPWTCQSQLARFNPVAETWDSVSVGSSGGGCMVDANDVLWVAGSSNRLLGVDIDTMALVQEIPIPGYAKGISIDFEGNVWAVSQGAEAWRVNPQTLQIDTFTGLTNPYTYSDMTGFALSQSGSPAG